MPLDEPMQFEYQELNPASPEFIPPSIANSTPRTSPSTSPVTSPRPYSYGYSSSPNTFIPSISNSHTFMSPVADKVNIPNSHKPKRVLPTTLPQERPMKNVSIPRVQSPIGEGVSRIAMMDNGHFSPMYPTMNILEEPQSDAANKSAPLQGKPPGPYNSTSLFHYGNIFLD